MTHAARVLSARPLLYAEGADPALDRPAHVRAASGLAWARTQQGMRLLVAQDDAAFVGVLEPHSAHVSARALPAGPAGVRQFGKSRNNKMHKLDLEAVCVVDGPAGARAWLVGSGSAPVREVIAVVDVARPDGEARVASVAPLHAALRAHPVLAGAELNLEGACVMGDTLVLLQRGNGRGGVNAVVRVPLALVGALVAEAGTGRTGVTEDAVRAALRVDRVELPLADGVPLTFTDAEPLGKAQEGELLFLAAAEASPNAIDDGEVVGCAVGVLSLSPEPRVRAWAPIVEEDGAPSRRKPEGIALDQDDPARAWLVVDMDDEHTPSELCVLELPAALRAR